MVNQRFEETIAANSTLEIALGSVRSIPNPGAKVTLYANAAAAASLRATLMLGSDAVLMRGWLSAPAVAGRLAIPDDFMAQGIGVGGDPVVLTIENVTAGGVIARGLVTLE